MYDDTTRFMKKVGWAISIFVVAVSSILIINAISANYKWERDYGSLWNLGVKQSSLDAKFKYVKEFADTLERDHSKFASHDAIWLETPDNSFEKNLQALSSLCVRLTEIQSMDPQSFQYNTAIEQITKQEQGEAHEMIGVFKGCWYLSNHPIIWGWINVTVILTLVVIAFVGIITLCVAYTD